MCAIVRNCVSHLTATTQLHQSPYAVPGHEYAAAGLERRHALSRTPSIGLMLNLTIKPGPFAFTHRFCELTSHSFGHVRPAPLCRGMSNLAALLRTTLACLAAYLGGAKKVLRSDVCNRPTLRVPVDRSTPEPAAYAAKTNSALCCQGSPGLPAGKERWTTLRQSNLGWRNV